MEPKKDSGKYGASAAGNDHQPSEQSAQGAQGAQPAQSAQHVQRAQNAQNAQSAQHAQRVPGASAQAAGGGGGVRGGFKAVSIQGYEGSFHQVAAQHFFGKDVQVIPCATFREVVKIAASKKESDGGVMAIENSIVGSILPNYNLLQKSNLRVVGEIYLQIRQHLLVNPGVKLEDIREVHSHHMALLQCIDFLEKYPQWKLVETEDTALSAKLLHQHRSKHTAAIASKLAADLFGLEVLAPNIHTMRNNYTRFLILQREDQALPGLLSEANKASVNFHTDHSRGSLARVLTAIAEGGINLSKLQSFPIPGSEWQYSFHADMEFDNLEQFNAVVAAIRPITAALNVYGIYKKGETV